jgi:hypothetical protein
MVSYPEYKFPPSISQSVASSSGQVQLFRDLDFDRKMPNFDEEMA